MKSRLKKFLSLVLCIAIIFTTLQTMVFHSNATEEVGEVVKNSPTSNDVYALYELKEKRESDTKHFMMSDGSILACVYSQDVHYKHNGFFEDIDNTLEQVLTEEGDKVYRNKANSFKVEFPENVADGYVKYSDENGYVMFKMVGVSNKKIEKKNYCFQTNDKTEAHNIINGIKYKTAKKNIDIEYDVTNDSLKETIVINKKTKESFVFEVVTSASKVIKKADGSIEFYDNDGKALYVMQSPYMEDAVGSFSKDINVILEKTDKGYLLSYTPNYNWLKDKDRVYPVRLDPTITTKLFDTTKVYDSYVFSTQQAGKDLRGTWDQFIVGKRSNQLTMRSFIKFDLPTDIGENDIIIDAKLHLVQDHVYTSNSGFKVELLELDEVFDEATVSWPTQPSPIEKVVDYAVVGTGNTHTYSDGGSTYYTQPYDTFNITKLVNKWRNGATNNGIMLRLHNESENINSNKEVYYYSKNNKYFKHVSKFLEISYRNNVGLEDYWNYSTQELIGAGVSYVNNYSGNLVFTHNDVINQAGNTAFTITHIYNSKLVRDDYINNSSTIAADEFYGNGWRLNIQQTFKPYVAVNNVNTNIKFVYTDGDGTEHYFVELSDGSIIDEDGLGFTYIDFENYAGRECKIVDKQDNELFFDTNGDLTEIIDANGNSIDIQFSNIPGEDEYYISSVVTSSGEEYSLLYDEFYNLTSIIDNAGRITVFSLDGGNDGDSDAYDHMYITYPDGTKTVFEVDDNDNLVQVTSPSGVSIAYQYYSTDAKIYSTTLYGADGEQGQILTFDYDYNQTKVSYQNDRYYVYQFDTFGRVTGIYDENKNVCTQKFTATSVTNSSIFSNNKLALVSNTSSYVNNLLKNGNFYNDFDGWDRLYSNNNYSIVTDKTYISSKSVKAVGVANESIVVMSYPNTESGNTYTLSAYLKLENVAEGYGAGVEIVTNKRRVTNMALGNTDESICGGFKRFIATITLDEDETILRTTAGLYSSTGTVYINSVQLEEGNTANTVNLIDNSSFERNNGVGTIPSEYLSEGGYGVTSSNLNDGSYAFKLVGDIDNSNNIRQEITHNGKAGDVYYYGAWAKADAVPTETEENSFIVTLMVFYNDGTIGWKTSHFNSFISDYQCSSGVAVMDKDYNSIIFHVCYQYNANEMYVDSLFLYRDTVQSYTYDDNGNVISAIDNASQESTYQYNDNNLSKLISPTGQNYTYNYDNKHNLVYSSSSNGVGYSVTYDSFGNPVSAETVKSSQGSKVESGKVYYIKNKNSGKCLTITDPALLDTTSVVQSSYTGSDMQKFRAILTVEGYYILKQYGSDTSIMSYYSRYEENTKVEMDNVAPGIFDVDWSHWTLSLDDVADGCYNIIARPAQKGAYMTVTNNSTAENAVVRLGYEDNSTAQQWYFVEVPEEGNDYANQVKPIVSGDEYYIRNAGSGQYLSIEQEPYNTVNVSQHTLGGCSVQSWSVKRLSNGYFIIRPSEHPDMALTFINRGIVNSNIDVEITGNGVDTIDWSHWVLEPINDGSGAFRVRAVVSATDTKYMGAEAGTNAVGGNVRFEAFAEDNYQKWYFVKRDEKISSSSVYTQNGAYLESVTDSRGNTTTYDYDEVKGLLNSVTDALGNTVEYTYNANNDRLLTVKSENSTVMYTYTTDGKLNTITTASGVLYNFSYDEFGRTTVIKVGSQALSSTEYVDSIRSLVKKQTYGNGTYRTYDYDACDRVIAEYVNGEKIAEYVYDKLGKVYKYTDVAENVSYVYEYDLIGRVLTISASDGRAIGYNYDKFNRTSETKQSVAGVSVNNRYHYNDGDGSIKAVSLNGTKKLSYGFDGFGRQNIKKLYTTTPFVTKYTFLEGTAGNTTTLVKTVKNANETLQYAYDKAGNITSVSKNGTVVESYTYDSFNQLKTVTRGSDVWEYTYDNGGNILSVKNNGATVKNYGYTDTEWKDKLTTFNGQTITYDAIGNPLQYRDGYVFTWSNGRQLCSAVNGTNSYYYTYNANGLRTSKTVNGIKTEYYRMGDILQGQKTGSEYIIYLYDENGTAYGLLLKNGTTQEYYYYIFNAQGDVIGIVDSIGTKVVEYTYGAWGEVLSITGTQASTIGQTNPIRYRGYYYDTETGFYLTGTRYYDPEIGRFINADSVIAGVGGSIQGYNMFAYCMNNPVNMSDPSGNWPKWLTNAVNWVANALGITTSTGSVATTGSSATAKGPTISRNTSLGIVSSKASGSLGYATGSFRGQATQKGSSSTKSMIGGFGKASVLNFDSQNRIGTQNIGISKKDVLDVGTVTAQAGIQYKDGLGISLGAKASVAAARGTYCVDVFGWKVEVGMSAQFLSYGYEFAYGALPEGGWGVKKGVSTGPFGYSYLIRITPS